MNGLNVGGGKFKKKIDWPQNPPSFVPLMTGGWRSGYLIVRIEGNAFSGISAHSEWT